ncbi:ferritin-like domain-containing protein [Oleiharenicola lentus]|uniref:ferritin-like domain-containing protein n=1 Tax=Oleiharenicola lentus TaxID=2508720 RepID=UPI003F66FA53
MKKSTASDRARISSQPHEIAYAGKKVPGGAAAIRSAKKSLGRVTSRKKILAKARSLKKPAKLSSVRDLLIEELKDLYSAEKQLLRALPKMARAAHAVELKAAFTNHLSETHDHVARLETAMDQLAASPRGKHCAAMEGLIKEGAEMIEEDALPHIKDLGLIAAAQKVEHYEIAGYGCARTLADLIGEKKVAALLQATLDQEGQADKLLTQIAQEIQLVPIEPATVPTL